METIMVAEEGTRRRRREPGDPLAMKRKMLMLQRNVTQGQLGERWGVKQPYVSEIINGQQRNLENERDFAVLMGMKYEELWPPPTERQLALEAAKNAAKKAPARRESA